MEVKVLAEEVIDTASGANNGAGPMWCYGSPTIVRDGDTVFASVWQVGVGVRPLCNTRWQLFRRRDGGAFERVQAGAAFNEREPCPLLRLPGGRIALSVNPARSLRYTGADGRSGYECEPHLLEFDAANPAAPPEQLMPAWDRAYQFSEHSYRAAAADGRTGELLLLNQTYDAETSARVGYALHPQCWSYRDASGNWTRAGLLKFPLRGCYAQVAIRGRAACVFAVSDVVEPNDAWREFKKKVTGQDWDYDFRQLYFTWTPDITACDFQPPLTVASRDETAGFLTNLDMWLGPDGDVHLLYRDRNVWHTFMRDEFFPGLPIAVALRYCRIRRGMVVERRTLWERIEEAGKRSGGTSGDVWAAFHAMPDGRLFVVRHAEGEGNSLAQLLPRTDEPPVSILLASPLKRFFTASERMGTSPSDVIDLYGTGDDAASIRYAQLRLVC
jgi:hypothetical protein